jgi:hypothetical protein
MARWMWSAMILTVVACDPDGGNRNDDRNGESGTLGSGPGGSGLGTGQHNGANIPAAAELTQTWMGDLSDGSTPSSLSFLEANFCVPGTQFEKFNGHHVYFTYAQPAGKQVYVRATPESDLTISLVVSQRPAGTTGSGPDAIAHPCETSLNYQRANPGVSETVKLTSISEPYHLVIGVAGAFGATEGEFAVDVYEE